MLVAGMRLGGGKLGAQIVKGGNDFETISQETPGKVKSGRVVWRIDEGYYECADENAPEE